MKKLFVIMLFAGLLGFVACDTAKKGTEEAADTTAVSTEQPAVEMPADTTAVDSTAVQGM